MGTDFLEGMGLRKRVSNLNDGTLAICCGALVNHDYRPQSRSPPQLLESAKLGIKRVTILNEALLSVPICEICGKESIGHGVFEMASELCIRVAN